MTIKEKMLEQIDLVEELQSVAGINIVNCGNCGSVLLHRITPLAMDTPIEDYDITCPYCGFTSEPCDFPDFLYQGMESSAEFDEESKADAPDLLEDAVSQITIPLLKRLEYGEEIELNTEYTLYHYTEDDVIVLNRTEDWEELYQILYNEETDAIIFEKLFN
jgi:DNA-directed RNA polymerase subunit RPC12/RpoP